MPSIFPFETAASTKKASKGRTTRVSRGEVGHEMPSETDSHNIVVKSTRTTEVAVSSTNEDDGI